MKFLGDVGVSTNTLKALREAGYDSFHLREQNLHRLPDNAILEKALNSLLRDVRAERAYHYL